ncbi:MAG TPA: hypothetical protein DCY79_11925 [Planctomycetaceae bacterium]|nr:hypothetical protein [Planctomycetaceae bacterium]
MSDESTNQPPTETEDAPTTVEIIDGDCLKTSAYDKVTSAVVAANLVLAFAVTLLLAFWLVRISTPLIREHFYQIETASLLAAPESNTQRRKLVIPETQELGLEESPVENLVQQVAVLAPSVADLETDTPQIQPRGRRLTTRTQDVRKTGTPDAIPAWNRWQLEWNIVSLDQYAQQLDYFQIDLGCAGGKPLLDYANQFATATPRVWTGRGSDEKRIYMSGRDPDVLAAIRKLLTKAGIATEGRITLQFLPSDLCQHLTKIEIQAATSAGHRLPEVKRTQFAVQQSAADYEFYVVHQEYLTAEL